VLRQHAVTPIADTPNNLRTARSMRCRRVVIGIRITFSVPLLIIEMLLEVATDMLPVLTLRMANDRLVWGSGDIVWKREPIIATENRGDQLQEGKK
jgi:hypothetical protein